MNILMIGSDISEAYAYFPINIRDISGTKRIEIGDLSLSFMSYRQGPTSNIESMEWDIIIITPRASRAIGGEAIFEEWLQPCSIMSKILIIDGELIK